MIGGVEVGRLFPFRIGRKVDKVPNKETTDPFTPIVEIVKDKDESDARLRIRADDLLEYLKLNSTITSDPKFYEQVNDGHIHFKALALLFKRFIPPGGSEFNEFMQSDTQKIIELYLRGVVNNAASLKMNVADRVALHIPGDLKAGIARYLGTYGIPSHYADRIFSDIGLPLPSSKEPLPIKRRTFQPNV